MRGVFGIFQSSVNSREHDDKPSTKLVHVSCTFVTVTYHILQKVAFIQEHIMTATRWLPEYSAQTLLFCTLITFTGYKVWTYLRHPLRKFPGPPLAAWTNFPYCYWLLNGRQPFVLLQLHEKYGPVVRTAPNELSFNTAASWKDIYGYRPGHRPFVKGDFYDGAVFVKRFGTRSLVNTRDPTEHGQMRRYLSNAFSEKSLREQEALVAQEVDMLVQKLEEYGGAKDGTDLQRWLNMATFDIVGSLSFGKSFDALQNGERISEKHGCHNRELMILRWLTSNCGIHFARSPNTFVRGNGETNSMAQHGG
jgi:hypothetical protein